MSKQRKGKDYTKSFEERVDKAATRGCLRSELVTAKITSKSRKPQEDALRALESSSVLFRIGPKSRGYRYIGRMLVGELHGRVLASASAAAKLELTEDLLRDFHKRDRHKREGLNSLPILWAWERYIEYCAKKGGTADIKLFHETLDRLAKSGRIDLVAHSDPASLTPEERAILRLREDGSLPYYWMPREL